MTDTETDTTEELEPITQEAPEQEDADAPVVITLGDEPEPEADDIELPEEAPGWAKRLRETAEERRKRLRELERENRELKAKAAPVEEEPEIGPKPNLLDPDIDGDEELFEERLLTWHSKKREADAKKDARQREAEEQQKAWEAKLEGYQEGKKRLRVADFDDAEEVVQTVFDQTQQGILVHMAKDAAVLAYAIGKNPDKAKELAAIKDPIMFTAALTRLEDQVKVSTRKPTAKPEGVVVSTARNTSALDNHLERLREEAARTGDFTKVMAYRRQLKAKQA